MLSRREIFLDLEGLSHYFAKVASGSISCQRVKVLVLPEFSAGPQKIAESCLTFMGPRVFCDVGLCLFRV
jgi:hypothetical protein